MANPVVINDALHTDAVGGVGVVSAVEARNSARNGVAHTGAGVRTGVFYEGTQSLITGTSTTSPNMTVQVAPLAWCGSKSGQEGVYLGRSPQTVTVDIAAAPASNSRIDSVYVMQRDQNATTSPDSITQGEIGVITGTAGVNPTAPAVPTGAVLLGTVTVAPGVTATTNAGCTVATSCQWTSGQGAPIPVRNQPERDALSAFDGLSVYRLDQHCGEVYDGSLWRGAVQTYTPAWTADTTNPGVGNGSITGTYRVGESGEVDATVILTFGNTGMTQGSGNYIISVPVAADINKEVEGKAVISSGATSAIMVPAFRDANTIRLIVPTSFTATSQWNASTPFNFASNATVRLRMRYTKA